MPSDDADTVLVASVADCIHLSIARFLMLTIVLKFVTYRVLEISGMDVSLPIHQWAYEREKKKKFLSKKSYLCIASRLTGI